MFRESCDINQRMVSSLAHTAALPSTIVTTELFMGGGSSSAVPYQFGQVSCFICDSRQIHP
jgi:hypothetical protein